MDDIENLRLRLSFAEQVLDRVMRAIAERGTPELREAMFAIGQQWDDAIDEMNRNAQHDSREDG